MPTRGGLKGCFKSQQNETTDNFRNNFDDIFGDKKKKSSKKAKKKEPITDKNIRGLNKCKNKDCGSADTELKPTVGGKIRVECKECKNRYDLPLT